MFLALRKRDTIYLQYFFLGAIVWFRGRGVSNKDEKTEQGAGSFADSAELFSTVFKEAMQEIATQKKTEREAVGKVQPDPGTEVSPRPPAAAQKKTGDGEQKPGEGKPAPPARPAGKAVEPQKKTVAVEKRPAELGTAVTPRPTPGKPALGATPAPKPPAPQKKAADPEKGARALLKWILAAVLLVGLTGLIVIYLPGKREVAQTPIQKREQPAIKGKEITAATEKQIAPPAGEAETRKEEPPPVKTAQPRAEPAGKEGALPPVLAAQYPYSISLVSHQSLDAARKAIAEYQEKGVHAYWAKVNLGAKGIWYRVFTGYFRSEAEALSFIASRRLKDAQVKMTKYSILVGVYSGKEEAEEKSSALAKKECSTYLVPAGQGRFLLYSGAFLTREGAVDAQREMGAQGMRTEVVER